MPTASKSEAVAPVLAPAEWQRHRATWLAWPHNGELWGDALDQVVAEFLALCRTLAGGGERIELLVHESADGAAVRELLGDLDIEMYRARYGDIWLRDTAPIFVKRGAAIEAVAFRFNGWGGKYQLDGDTEVARTVARRADVPLRQLDWIGEGGALDFNGGELCLASAACLLSPERNPDLDRRALEHSLLESFGARRVVWLEEVLAGDHTDGHVDTLARFVSTDRVLCAEAAGPDDPNSSALVRTREALEAVDGLDVVAIPSPGAVSTTEGELLPASYLNFYIGNEVVVVPTYGCANDSAAIDMIADSIPDRAVVGLSARAILEGGGAFHCITQQEPCL